MNNIENSLNLYIVRHGETKWNVQKRFQGQTDSDLTEKGKKKVGKTGEELKNILFDAVYTSELGRAVKSAEIILSKNINKESKLQKLSELNEVYFGKWQGLSYNEIFEKYPEEANNYFYDIKKYYAKNIEAEELKDALDRFLKGMDKIVKNHKSRNILVVTHGTVLEMFINHVINKDTKDIDERKLIGNGKYRIFTYKNGEFLTAD